MTSKIIIQTDKTAEIREEWKPSPQSLREYLPGWEYQFYDDEKILEFVRVNYPELLETFLSYPHNIQRVDVFRYLKLYKDGGFYSDMDYKFTHPLEELFYNEDGTPKEGEVFLMKSPNVGKYFTNSIMASKPGAKIWLDVIEEIKKDKKWWMVGRHLQVIGQTGPGMLDRVVKRKGYKYYGITLLPVEKLSPCNICEVGVKKPDAWSENLPGGSWTSWDTKVYNWTFCNWKWLLLLVLIIIVAIFLVIWFVKSSSVRNNDVISEVKVNGV